MIPPITASVEADALPRHFGEPANGGWCDRLFAGAFEHSLRPLGIHLRMVADRLEAADTLF